MEPRVSLLTTQDIVLCRRVTVIWSQTTEPEGAQRPESCSEGQTQEAKECLPLALDWNKERAGTLI
jgi:hypothetical protein